ncbi:FAM172 family protein homolog CG10038 isoform X2 [Belonocnema kinseyi]|uniref:FAM172 family protein homolog CG10038 isoform X2 n=1 Tax=Belonocnema kinseyi TaxID=2817044 RepID=UPI00143D5DC7|nr:FAM172 family protein homolog CG10038 isoform X2 [Belonocnema kinseyi]
MQSMALVELLLIGFSAFMCAVKNTMAKADFPKSLREFGYDFNENGKLRKIDPVTGATTNESFDFNVSDDADYNQKHYEALGEIINHHVYGLLEKEELKRLPVPKDSSDPVELRTFIFASEDYLENDKLIVLIHGSGVVRAGQWARRLIINDNLNSGTQIPYVKKARELGYAVIVLNTNDNNRVINGKQKAIKRSENPEIHMETVWKDYIQDSKAMHIAIIAHSYGGVCTVKFGMNHVNVVKERIFAIALTDSVHVMASKGVDHIVKVARNWVSSEKPLDTPELSLSGDIERVSSGHSVHEMTSWSCIESLFKYIDNQYKSTVGRSEL